MAAEDSQEKHAGSDLLLAGYFRHLSTCSLSGRVSPGGAAMSQVCVGILARTAIPTRWRGQATHERRWQSHPFCETSSSRGETWCYWFDPESKHSQISLPPKKSHLQKSKVKTMLITFFDNDGIIYKDFVPAGQTVNTTFYEQVLKALLQCICHVQLELHRTGKLMLLHDNAPVHCAIYVHQFLAKQGVPVLSHPPYSPVLVPVDFCFPI
ncbi:hypothetical protein PR048_011373 [Dryococelus australis]|uniref:Mariner Mos1 transposase n=1 Tax=Dryococelus australis TaxID=614101 RepID=A0ABQ9HLG9_9NEOP|nr:hypothetical protein PR048_011373 [Dryococelus australis]